MRVSSNRAPMESDAAKRLVAQFDEKYPDQDEVEAKLGEVFRTYRVVTKSDLIQVIRWKQDGVAPYLVGNVRRAEAFDGSKIDSVSRDAFRIPGLSDRQIVGRLVDGLAGSGAGLKTVSALLAFWKPERYGVYDFHAWRGLVADGQILGPHTGTVTEYVEHFLPALRREAARHRLTVREMEKAYFELGQ